MDRHADSASNPGPTAEHFHLLRRLRRLLQRSEGACLIFLWCDDPRPLAWLHTQLDRSLRARSLRMLDKALLAGPTDTPPDIEAALSPVLTALLEPEPGADRMAVWVDLGHASAGRPCRDWLLARLNERRAQLLHAPRAVVLAGLAAYEAQAAEVAPDLWSVRDFSAVVPVWGHADMSTSSAMDTSVPAASEALGQLWDAAWARHQANRAEDAESDSRLDLQLGFSVVTEALQRRQLTRARQVLAQTAAVVAEQDEVDAQLRWSAQQFTWEGDLAMQERQLLAARKRYEEGLRVRERLVKVTEESPEALYDLACSVERIGDLHRQSGNAPAARACFERQAQLAESALRQSPLSVDFQNLLANARARLAAMPPDTP
jgi:tetratricopeptide (TPR) repeat protein